MIPDQLLDPHRRHPRLFQRNRYLYPVLSRRSRGISIGINLNPDKVCNFDCVYCQVDRRTPPEVREVDVKLLLGELEETLQFVQTGRLYNDERFAGIPMPLRRLNDIAFSGDGEPTTYPGLAEIVRDVAALKSRRCLDGVKLVLITNATMFHRPAVQEALKILDANNGEVWAKLEAGTEAYYRAIERTTIPLERVLSNILSAARVRPIVIQSLFLTLEGEGPSEAEIEAYVQRLGDILAGGGQIAHVQVYSVARAPAEACVGPLPTHELERIGAMIRSRLGIPAEVFAGAPSD
jgi:wyosine [tRNA(Phe)-imidazoG37] synthetase (radical SAM superfamily)